MNMTKWITAKEGIRYREHTTRKHGIAADRYYTIRYYQADGSRKEEPLGWASQTGITTKKAAAILAKLKANHVTGIGPATIAEQRAIKKQDDQEKAQKVITDQIRNITFSEIFTSHYYPEVQHNRKNWRSIKREEALFRLWIEPIIGTHPIREVVPLHLEKIKKDMLEAGRSPGSIQYALAVVRQVFNHAIQNRLFDGRNPADKTGGVKRPKVDNRRTRFLTREEADSLLAELWKRSADVHDMALFSLHTGARAGEIFNLRWGDVNLPQGLVIFKDTKSSKNRPAFLTEDVKTMLANRQPEDAQSDALVFPGKEGIKIAQISDSFDRAVKTLKLNEGVTDRLIKVTFHTLRHTFASWLAMDGINPFHLKELMGHSDLKLTERYSHLSNDALREAALRVNAGVNYEVEPPAPDVEKI